MLGPLDWWWQGRVEHLWCEEVPGQHGGNSSSLTTQMTNITHDSHEQVLHVYTSGDQEQAMAVKLHVSAKKPINRPSLLGQITGWRFQRKRSRRISSVHISGGKKHWAVDTVHLPAWECQLLNLRDSLLSLLAAASLMANLSMLTRAG